MQFCTFKYLYEYLDAKLEVLTSLKQDGKN